MSALVPYIPAVAEGLAEELNRARAFSNGSRSKATLVAYGRDWINFERWCAARTAPSLPTLPPILAAYAAYLADAGRKVPTIVRAISAVCYVHVKSGRDSPRGAAVDETMRGIRLAMRRDKPVQKDPALAEHLRAMVMVSGNDLIDVRNKALLLLGFAGAFRRSELVALELGDMESVTEGLRVTVQFSKTDQEGKGHVKGIPFGTSDHTCPVRAVRAWIDGAGITHGLLFRSMRRHGRVTDNGLLGSDVARLVKKMAAQAGIKGDFAGHSLRAGLVTEAYKAGKTTHRIMQQTGHKSVQTLERYIRLAELFRDNAASNIGL